MMNGEFGFGMKTSPASYCGGGWLLFRGVLCYAVSQYKLRGLAQYFEQLMIYKQVMFSNFGVF
jgi:hypothetical protein